MQLEREHLDRLAADLDLGQAGDVPVRSTSTSSSAQRTVQVVPGSVDAGYHTSPARTRTHGRRHSEELVMAAVARQDDTGRLRADDRVVEAFGKRAPGELAPHPSWRTVIVVSAG